MQVWQYLLFCMCLRKVRLVSNCEQEVKVSQAHPRHLSHFSSTLKKLWPRKINDASEKQINMPMLTLPYCFRLAIIHPYSRNGSMFDSRNIQLSKLFLEREDFMQCNFFYVCVSRSFWNV